MKERPVLFSSPMVRAILDGTKTQTRRIVKPQPEFCGGEGEENDISKWGWHDFAYRPSHFLCVKDSKCPYGQPGDRLWVREAFTTYPSRTAEEEAELSRGIEAFQRGDVKDIVAAARALPGSSGPAKALYKADYAEWADNPDSDLGPWKPSIFMPRWASRITLEVTGVRVERLQDITPADACAEGAAEILDRPINDPLRIAAYERGEWKPSGDDMEEGEMFAGAVEAYAALWESINGPGSWDVNPWVWVIEFSRLQ